MLTVGITVGPFEVEVEHVHNIQHVRGRTPKLTPHKHPISLKLHFQATQPGQDSFLDIHSTRADLEECLRSQVGDRLIEVSFEQMAVNLFGAVNSWIPDFCDKFGLSKTFSLTRLNVAVESEQDELHHSQGVSEYIVEQRTLVG